MILLDLCCKAGGASEGYRRAGFTVIGIDKEPQPNYPFQFIQADIRDLDADYLLSFGPIAIHASPPCQTHSKLNAFSSKYSEDLVPETRALLLATGLPYIIENVRGAPLKNPIQLCGSTFHLGVRRHRIFETNWNLPEPQCEHKRQKANSPGYTIYSHGNMVTAHVVGVYGHGQGLGIGEVKLWRQVMDIDWMTSPELAQAIPPAYTKYIGENLLVHLGLQESQIS